MNTAKKIKARFKKIFPCDFVGKNEKETKKMFIENMNG